MRTNLQFVVNYDYIRTGCTCNEEICRCTKIEDAHITDFPVNTIVKELSNNVDCSTQLDYYCFDRICRINKIYNKDCYCIDIVRGYYGEEVDGIYFEREDIVKQQYRELLACRSDIDKLKYVLKLEYGYLITSIDCAKSLRIVECSPSEVKTLQEQYLKHLDEDVVNSYTDYELPCAVCKGNNKEYKLIDGYHRIVANMNKSTISIIVVE